MVTSTTCTWMTLNEYTQGKDKMENLYAAQVAPLQFVRPIPGKDKIKLATVCGEEVIIGVEHEEGELGIFFPTDAVICDSFLLTNGLLEIRDEFGKKIGGGYFETGRVRAKKFGGVKSCGFWMPLTALRAWADAVGVTLPELKLGVEISEVGEVVLCSKYVPKYVQRTPGTPNKIKSEAKNTKCPMFKEHADTGSLGKVLHTLKVGDRLQVTKKMEGTSGRSSRFRWYQPKKPYKDPSFWVGILHLLSLPVRKLYELFSTHFHKKLLEQKMEIVASPKDFCGTRRVQLNPVERAEGYFGTTDFRWLHHQRMLTAVSEGMTIYYEIVGYNGDVPIQPRHNPSDTQDKDFIKKWGKDPFVYSYGCGLGQSKVFIYRITWMDDRGRVWEFSPEQIQQWALEAGVEAVPVLADELIVVQNDLQGCWVRSPLGGEPRLLLELLDELIEANETLHPDEGCIVRVLNRPGWLVFKYKIWFYKAMAGLVKPDQVDTEEEAAGENE